MMRAALLLACTAGLAACGQTGALYLPDESVQTPVEIRGPGQAATAPATAPTTPPATPSEPDKDRKEEKPTPPPAT